MFPRCDVHMYCALLMGEISAIDFIIICLAAAV